MFFDDGFFQSDKFKTVYSLSGNEKHILRETLNLLAIFNSQTVYKLIFDKLTKNESDKNYMIDIIIKLNNIIGNKAHEVNNFELFHLN